MRYSKQQKQEKISRNQFNQFLDQFKWITSDVYPDLGEDILVRIYDDGFSTGISFYVQLKSVEDITSHKLQSGVISYKLEVKDLVHWEFQGIPVLFVVWDVNKERGWWRWISEIIRDNDERKAGWRSQTTIKVHINTENELDENSLIRIRYQLADYFLPNISKDTPIDK